MTSKPVPKLANWQVIDDRDYRFMLKKNHTLLQNGAILTATDVKVAYGSLLALKNPPRDGAFELIKAITLASAPMLIVYVSCNPATLARDAGVIVNEKGYHLSTAGVINMSPHTAHVESNACFIKN